MGSKSKAMQRNSNWFLLLMTALIATALVAGCSGGSSSGGPEPIHEGDYKDSPGGAGKTK